MRILLVLSLLLFVHTNSLGQNCDFPDSFKRLEQLEQVGSFDKALELLGDLESCENLKKNSIQYIDLLLWKYKFKRNRLNERRELKLVEEAYNIALTHRKELLNNTEFLLVIAEAYAMSKKQKETEEILNKIALNKENNDDHTKQRRLADINFIRAKSYGINPRETQTIFPLYLQFLSTYDELGLTEIYYRTQALKSLGIMSRINADFDDALNYHKQELALYETRYPKGHIEIANTNYNIGNNYYEKMMPQEALNSYLITYDIWSKVKDPKDRYMKFVNEAIGDMYWELKDYKNALKFFNLSVKDENKINNDTSEQPIKFGDSLLTDGNYGAAMDFYKEALAWRESTYGKNHVLTGACKNFVGRAHGASGRIEAALKEYQGAINILVPDLKNHSLYSNPTLDMRVQSEKYLLESLSAKGILLKELYDKNRNENDLTAAFETLERAIALTDKMKNSSMSESSRTFWTKRTLSLTENAISTAIELHKLKGNTIYLDRAFQFAEKSKALLLLAAIHDHEITSFANVPKSILEQEKQFKKQINHYAGKVETEEKRCAERREKMLKLWQEELLKLRNDYQLFLSDLKSNYPDYYGLKFKIESTNIEKARETLDDNTAIIEYFFGKKNIFVFVICQNKSNIYSIPVSEKLKHDIGLLFNNLNSLKKIQSKPQQVYVDYTASAHSLYNSLLKDPIKELPADISRLIIVPDGSLAYIPFECLLTEEAPKKRNYKNLKYMLNDYALSYSPSAAIRLLSRDAKSNNDYHGFAPNYKDQIYNDRGRLDLLYHNVSEVEYAASIFKGTSWQGGNVTEELFNQNIKDAGLIHLAMHAEVEDEHPLLSKLFFNSSNENDGMLHTYEIYGMNIPAQLTILSACNTASGKWEHGEGIMSLERAFQYAGSNSLLTTLWSVDDASSSELMKPFFESLKQGNSKDISLQQARIEYLKNANPSNAHPFFWSSYKLTGNTAPLKTNNNLVIYLVIITGLAGLLILTGKRRKRKKRVA